MTLNEYIEQDYPNRFDEIEGFNIRNGKKIYWYITPMRSGLYRCLPAGKTGILGWARYIPGITQVGVIYKSQKDL